MSFHIINKKEQEIIVYKLNQKLIPLKRLFNE